MKPESKSREKGVRDPKTFTFEQLGTTEWLVNGTYKIDTEFHNGNGCCSCPDHEFRMEPLLLAARAAGDSKSVWRCKHLLQAFHRLENGKLKAAPIEAIK